MGDQERDRYLTEAIHPSLKGGQYLADSFSTWEGFGKLWDWCSKQIWWESFCLTHDPLKTFGCWEAIINPDKFAGLVCEFLKDWEGK